MFDVEELAATSLIRSKRIATQYTSLRVADGPHCGELFPLNREMMSVGRGEWCDIVLHKDLCVSKYHCELIASEGMLRVRDIHSSNGIYLDNHRVFDAYFQKGARLKVGRSVMELLSSEEPSEIEVHYQDASGLLVGHSEAMRKLFSMLSRLGKSDTSVLITGETGTGKSLIAQALHAQSERADGPFVVINCSTLPATLIEAELFGYEKGAFTGADKGHEGLLERAKGGTLFLDEIDSLSLELQPKLLDVLERKRLRRVGGCDEIPTDFRLIASSLLPLEEKIAQREFRIDLYYRLAVVQLSIPPLRSRPEDIPYLIQSILQRLVPERTLNLTPEALLHIQRGLWPGNIRELRNFLERALNFIDGNTIDLPLLVSCGVGDIPSLGASASQRPPPAPVFRFPEDNETAEELPRVSAPLPFLNTASDAVVLPFQRNGEYLPLKQMIEEIERTILTHHLYQIGGTKQETAERLQISEGWLYKRIKKYNLRQEDFHL